MTSPLENLSKPGGSLTREPSDERELAGLKRSGLARLKDARNTSLEIESRFDLVYNAAHSLCLAALRSKGFRAQHRYIVFQVVPHTLDLGPEVWRVLDKGHRQRNLAEYEGVVEVDERLVLDMIHACDAVAAKLEAMKG